MEVPQSRIETTNKIDINMKIKKSVVSIDYILWLNRLQEILEYTTDIKLFGIEDDNSEYGYRFTDDIQFEYRMISSIDPLHSIYKIGDIKNIPFDESLENSYPLVKRLQDALNTHASSIITPKGEARIHFVEFKERALFEKNSVKRNTRQSFVWLSTMNGNNIKLYNDDSLKLNYKEKPIWYNMVVKNHNVSPNSLPAWINGGKDAQIHKRILYHSTVTLFHMYPNVFDLKNKGTNVTTGRKGLQYITNMIRNVQYKDGVDVNRMYADENTIYYYRNKKVIKSIIDNKVLEINKPSMDSKNDTFNEFVDYLFEEALALFYCNLSHGIFTLTEFQRYGIEIIWYIMCSIIGGSGAMEEYSEVDWIPDFTMEYFFSRVYTKVQGVKTDLSKALKKIKPTRITRIMYVKGQSKKAKDDWKERKGIERNKSQKQIGKENTLAQEIVRLKGEGKLTKDIAVLLNISTKTVSRYLSKGLNK